MVGSRDGPGPPNGQDPGGAESGRWVLRPIGSIADVDGVSPGDLSDWFNPFLAYFMAESLRCGGEVVLAKVGPDVAGIYLYSPSERIGSVFTRSREIAEAFYRQRAGTAMYAPFALGGDAESYLIFSARGGFARDERPFAHPVRIAGRRDLPKVTELLREVFGEVDARWIETMPDTTERCFVAEVDGSLAGAAWASIVGGVGRFHSLAVRPPYRRLGIGTDLFHARRLWLGAAGAQRLLSEIAERNAPSRRIAEQGGLREVGRIYRMGPAPPTAP